MEKTVKVNKEVFDAALSKIIRAPGIPLSKIHTKTDNQTFSILYCQG